jgi:hypothetical protein
MNLDRAVPAFAGAMGLVSVALTHFVSPQRFLANCLSGFEPAASVAYWHLPDGYAPTQIRL